MVAAGLPWIRLQDFEETSLWITITNNFTHSSLTSDDSVELGEVSETEITLKVPTRSCSEGHLLVIQIDLKKKGVKPEVGAVGDLKAQKPLTFTAKVTESDSIDKDSKTIRLKLYQVDIESWREFLRVVSQKQIQASAIVKTIQGE